jgi:signal peptidase I
MGFPIEDFIFMSKTKEETPFFSWKNFKELAVLATVVFALRSSIISLYHVPTPSMSPTIQVGDRLFAWKLSYGFRVPFTDITLWRWADIKRGDIVVFRYPKDPSIDYVKRIVGVPGDQIQVRDDVLYINGKAQEKISHDFDRSILDAIDEKKELKQLFVEDIEGKKHWTMDNIPSARYFDFSTYPTSGYYTVPEGHVFAMGDNRYNSADSRIWGPVPIENVVGKAFIVLWSMIFFDGSWVPHFRFGRFGHILDDMG